MHLSQLRPTEVACGPSHTAVIAKAVIGKTDDVPPKPKYRPQLYTCGGGWFGRLGLNTKWLCRADHAELSLTLAAPSAVTGCTLAWGLEPRARRCWRLICCCPG